MKLVILMSKLMSKKIKVVISGDGADELLEDMAEFFKPIDFYKKNIKFFLVK